MARGIKEGDPAAEYICWLYMPAWKPLAPWVHELSAHLPKDVTLQVNFESGAVKYQLDRPRVGGDYWLSFVGPSDRFARIAQQAVAHGTPMSAKLQVGCSHESATIPFMPVPSLLYRKYREMPALGVASVMQCWYFGNYPGVMNRAAGAAGFRGLSGTGGRLPARVGRRAMGRRRGRVVEAWQHFAEAFQNFPLSTRFQWCGPMHATPVWPLHLKPALRAAAAHLAGRRPVRRRRRRDARQPYPARGRPSRRQNGGGVGQGSRPLEAARSRVPGNRERLLDIGLAEAIGIQFASAHDVLNFYLMRSRLFDLPPADAADWRPWRPSSAGKSATASGLAVLCAADSRLGFHCEAERHQYCPTRLRWRVAVPDGP